MYIVIAPNAFKGSISAKETASLIAAGFRQSHLSCQLKLVPIADGGDGTSALVAQWMDSMPVVAQVHDPLGRKINAIFRWIADEKTAIIEMSDASGLRLLKKDELNILQFNTKGTGELILAALEKGAEKLILGVGGSATVDGATGLLSSLGIRFLNDEGNEIIELPLGLMQLKSIDTSGLDPRFKACEVVVLCDVQNTLLGKNGAAAIFGPQKGADEKDVIVLEECMKRLNEVTEKALNIEMASLIYGGSSGGVAAGLAAFVNAELVSGIEFFLDVIDFDQVLQKADLVITAEGSLDNQTLAGKGPYGVARRAKNKKIPVIGLAGQVPLKIGSKMHKYFDVLLSIGHSPSSIQESIDNTAADIKRTSCELGNLLALRQKMI